MMTRSRVLGLVVLLGCFTSAHGQSPASLSDVLSRVEDALRRVDPIALQAYAVNEYAVAPETFEGIQSVRFGEARQFGVQRFRVTRSGLPVFELEAIFSRRGGPEDALATTEPWRLISLRELTEAPDDYMEVIRGLRPNLEGKGPVLPAKAHEYRFADLVDRLQNGAADTRAFLEENRVTSLLNYQIAPDGETLVILRGLEAIYSDDEAGSFDVVFEKHTTDERGGGAANWHITFTTLTGLGTRSLFDQMMVRIQRLTGAGEEDAAALLFDMVDLFEDLELHLNLIANPARGHDKRLETVRETLETFFESRESVVQISSKKYGLVIPRSVDRYLRRLSRLDELFGYRRVRFDFEQGVEFQDIQRIAGQPDTYDAVFVLWQIFESENAEGRVYQDATKKRFRAVIRRSGDREWDIKLTQVLVDDTQTLDAYLRYIRPSLIKETVRGGI